MHKLIIVGAIGLGAVLLFRAPSARGPAVGGAGQMAAPPPVYPPGWLGLGAPSSAAWRAQRVASGRR